MGKNNLKRRRKNRTERVSVGRTISRICQKPLMRSTLVRLKEPTNLASRRSQSGTDLSICGAFDGHGGPQMA
jgi:hypothetical protein